MIVNHGRSRAAWFWRSDHVPQNQLQPRIFTDEHGLIESYSVASVFSLPRGFRLQIDPRHPRKSAAGEAVESFFPSASYIPLVWSPPLSVRWFRWKPKRPKSRVGCGAVTLTCSTL